MTPGRPVSASRTTMSEVMLPNDANFLGNVFGGRLLSMIDLCAYTVAARHSGEMCVTASFDRVDFLEPIHVSEVVIMEGYATFVGRTSIEITIDVYSERVFERTRRHTNTARVTMVAVRDGKPVPIPPLICETRAEKLHFLEGRLRRELRKKHQEERDELAKKFRDASDEELDRLMASQSLS